MKSFVSIMAGGALVAAAAAAPDPLITPRAELAVRQNDPALLGWLSGADGEFSESRTCDAPQTLSSSGNLVQCCGSGSDSCVFWSSCSAGTLFAQSTSLFCDQGFCNTAVLVPSAGANSGQNYLGCWATSLGQQPFTLVRDIGDASIVPPTTASGGETQSTPSRTITTPTSAATSAQGSAMQSAATTSTAAAPATLSTFVQPLSGMVGLLAILFSL